MTNREMFLLATSVLFASTTVGLALQGILHKPRHGHGFDRPGFDRPWDARNDDKRGGRPNFFAMADADKDGYVTKDELMARQKARIDEMFATMDTNKDGKLSPEEMEKGRDLMRAKMKARFEAERTRNEPPAPVAAE